MTLPLTRHRFTVEDYCRMAEVGILTADDRVELLNGEIVEMPPIGDRHAASVDRIADLFFTTFRDATSVRVQGPLHLSRLSQPQPDLMLLRRKPDYYASGHPTPQDVLLLVEVADTSLAVDRQVKMPLYARGGILEYWLVDLEEATLTVYREPTPQGYRLALTLRRGDTIAPLAFPDRELAVADLLG